MASTFSEKAREAPPPFCFYLAFQLLQVPPLPSNATQKIALMCHFSLVILHVLCHFGVGTSPLVLARKEFFLHLNVVFVHLPTHFDSICSQILSQKLWKCTSMCVLCHVLIKSSQRSFYAEWNEKEDGTCSNSLPTVINNSNPFLLEGLVENWVAPKRLVLIKKIVTTRQWIHIKLKSIATLRCAKFQFAALLACDNF